MTIILLWIVTSIVVGWFGRKRIVGFWGFLGLSLFFSPVLTGLFLLVAAPGKKYRAETQREAVSALLRAGVKPGKSAYESAATRPGEMTGPLVPHLWTRGLTRLMMAWVAIVVVFGLIYYALGRDEVGFTLTNGSFGLVEGMRLSLDIGTMGSVGDEVPVVGLITWLSSFERLLVLGILVLMVSSLIGTQFSKLRANDMLAAPAASTIALAHAAEPAPSTEPPHAATS